MAIAVSAAANVPVRIGPPVCVGISADDHRPERGGSAADLKFLHHLQRTQVGTSNRKRHYKHILVSAPLLPKFLSESAAMYHELRKRGTTPAGRRRPSPPPTISEFRT